MAGIFDRLQKEIDNKKQAEGITALDLAELSPPLRKIMRLMLREIQSNYPSLCAAIQEMPDEERMSIDDFNRALDTLTLQLWLTRIGEGERAIYKVNIRRRSGSSLPSGIWAALDAKMKDKPE